MLIMNDDGMQHLLSSKFELGADASVAAGPVGRHAEGNTDWKMRAQVLTYSRARGVFAGVSLNGAVVKQDKDATREFYGHMVTFKAALTGEVDPPPAAHPFLSTLANWARGGSEVSLNPEDVAVKDYSAAALRAVFEKHDSELLVGYAQASIRSTRELLRPSSARLSRTKLIFPSSV